MMINFLKMLLKDIYTCRILGPLVPIFGISGDISSGLKSQSGLCLVNIYKAEIPEILRSLRSLLLHLSKWLLVASLHASTEVGVGSGSNGQ